MGRNKMMLELDRKPLVRHAVERAFAAGLSPVIVVTGHEPDRLRDSLAGLRCSFAYNEAFTGPTSRSLHRGLDAVPADVNNAVIMLADMPFVSTAMLKQLVDVMRTNPAPLAASRYGDVLAPPLFFRRALFAELLAWHGEGCGKQVVMTHREEAAILDWEPGALVDIDTADDAAKAGFVESNPL
jgi:molybdenum cofactor cytidylyltransferase